MAGSTLMRQLLWGRVGELTENGLVEGEGTQKTYLDDFISKVLIKIHFDLVFILLKFFFKCFIYF